MIEQEPVENRAEFTLDELGIIRRALINETVQIYFPPANLEEGEIVSSVIRKVDNLIKLKLEKDEQ